MGKTKSIQFEKTKNEKYKLGKCLTETALYYFIQKNQLILFTLL